jgi:hypothetical protein
MFILIAKFIVFVVCGKRVAVGIRKVQRNILMSPRQIRVILWLPIVAMN